MDKNQVVEAIGLQKARYCRYVDTGQWDAFEQLIGPEFECSFIDPSGTTTHAFRSSSEFVAQCRIFLEGAQSAHHVHNPEIEVLSDHEASAIWAMQDTIAFPRGDTTRPLSMRGFGHYHERWRLRRGEWRLARMELRRTLLQLTPQESAS